MEEPVELVVLVDDDGTPIGSHPKATVHTTDTPLHLAFSCHVLNAAGDVLVSRRALSKKTWPGVWTNAFCGHPAPGEDMEEAVRRRARDELGLELGPLTPILPDFRYRAVDAGGIVEHEVCPVFEAVALSEPAPNPAEVEEVAWVAPAALRAAVAGAPFAFSPWLAWQLQELDRDLAPEPA
ncbi:isopentenyl-diphosphate Delta-isomerase [Agrococcus jejuensis]|uniref:Isopentenyl-diphosphate Delta-isomerase n=1 Tax=Agrococcus jejuensis TaxID=399736 RepID=A0A1G8D077_9MICO|nr:isopentenyl-diphosphate Delta-isomerase [Agrococcus jejuensis]SDH50914.1 isopentenyl-diphosphate delta-isomerase [Agrococcus jejuensis]